MWFCSPLTNTELRFAFYSAVFSFLCWTKIAVLFNKMQSKSELTIETKNFVLLLEAEQRWSGPSRSAPPANIAVPCNSGQGNRAPQGLRLPPTPTCQSGPHTNCFRCTELGHESKDCPLKTKNFFSVTFTRMWSIIQKFPVHLMSWIEGQ